MQKIAPFLWFKDNNAEEAVDLYTSVFKSSRVISTQHAGGAGPWEKGQLILISFEVAGQQLTAFNGGPAEFGFNEAISLVVSCDTQEEIDSCWDALTANGGKPIQCGWLQDKFGLRWQIVPANIGDLIKPDAAMKAMMSMVKLDIAALEKAGASKPD